ncbi:hypothetical protein ACNFB1_13090 [Pseudomonas sp. NY15349]|uniref:hypothetical protein n=1 Tax=unclassified Pseudomonas TaxID=196821 RepID=UPI001F1F6821|nr:hypothetical protein [Pseudomonas sp. LM20]MCE5990231.1 hypothetical protein [Pseudomonas sp. LM20]
MQLLRYGKYQATTMVSESGAYTLLAHHHVPKNRHLRWWLTHEVVVVLAGEVDQLPQVEKRKLSWRECAQRALRLHGV